MPRSHRWWWLGRPGSAHGAWTRYLLDCHASPAIKTMRLGPSAVAALCDASIVSNLTTGVRLALSRPLLQDSFWLLPATYRAVAPHRDARTDARPRVVSDTEHTPTICRQRHQLSIASVSSDDP